MVNIWNDNFTNQSPEVYVEELLEAGIAGSISLIYATEPLAQILFDKW